MKFSIVNYSELFFEQRIGAEFYHPDKINALNSLSKHNVIKIKDVFDKKSEILTPEDLDNKNIALLELENISNFSIKDIPIINGSRVQSNKYKAKNNDVIISRLRPYLKQVGIINHCEDVITTTEFIILRHNNNKVISPEYLYIYLCTDKIQKILFWSQEGTNHPRVPFFVFEDTYIPHFINLQKTITNIVKYSNNLINQSKSLYKEAENTLLKELGLENWQPKHKLSYIKHFSDTERAERIDAEYFQPMYDEIIGAIKRYKNGHDIVQNLININEKNFNPEEEKIYKYIELSNISANSEIKSYTEEKGIDLPTRARRKVKHGDLIISSIEGSLESIALITHDFDNIICSTGFFALSHKSINAETLLLLFKSQIGQLQLKKGCSGTILTAISNDEFRQIILPKIPEEIQKTLKYKILEMYQHNNTSKSLLYIAKRAVEIAIEESEEIAVKWLEAETDKLRIEIK